MDEPTLHKVVLTLCSACLDGVGSECHTPGCALIWSRCPDVPLRDRPDIETIDGVPFDYNALKRAAMPSMLWPQFVFFFRRTPAVGSAASGAEFVLREHLDRVMLGSADLVAVAGAMGGYVVVKNIGGECGAKARDLQELRHLVEEMHQERAHG